MDVTNAFEIASKVLSVGGAFATLILVLGKQKAIIARNRRRIEKLESDLEKLKDIARSLGADMNNIQIKLNHAEKFLDRTTDFAPVITSTDFGVRREA